MYHNHDNGSNRHFSVTPYITICKSTETYCGLYLRGAMSGVTGIYLFRLLLHIVFFVLRSIFMPPKELWEAYSNRTVRPSVSLSRFGVRSISPIFFEVGIPNLVCGCILRWRSVAYHFQVTVALTLTSDLVFRIIVSGAYLLYYLR